jgi:serine/threonine protein kinase/tetratricopeptide (TPR) repeat protein
MPTPQNLEELLLELALSKPADQRAAWLDRECEGDPALRQRLDALLAARAQSEAIPIQPAQTINLQFTGEAPDEAIGQTLGHYKLLERIGEGGCGVVYVADQSKPVRRRVALKVIKLGMDTKAVVARFEAERQALAMMDHPNIAKVLDAGATEKGRPYFVMELVRGVRITEYCDQNKLATKDRLDLFMKVCQAIQHAHQKGIIHRDIKPSNILVTLHDGVPVPKVIDFGIAKATEGRLTEHTIYTQLNQFVGTPAYMSPEQAEVSGLDIDTRSDIYSLGVLLYELLTGSPPFDPHLLVVDGIDSIRRTIREIEPPRPSTRLSTMQGEALTATAKRHGTESLQLLKTIRGDLDWIVMKCLEKDRTRRYETANGLAADLKRHLNNEPVLACPPSTAYRFQKSFRRNKLVFAAATAVFVALCLGIVATTLQSLRATRAEKTTKEAKNNAVAREAETKAVLEFVENHVLAAARPEGQQGGLGRDVTMRKAIEAAAQYINAGFTNQPLIEARLRMTLGKSFYFLGDAQRAAEQEEAARAIYARLRGPDDPDTLLAMHNLASSYDMLGRIDEALKLREETLARRRARLGSDNLDTIASMNNLGLSYGNAGRMDDALKLREETLARFKAVEGKDHPDTLMAMNNLANAYFALGRYDDALKLREETLALYKAKLGPDHPDTLRAMGNLATSLDFAGRHDEALRFREETLALRRAKLGPDHYATLLSMSALGDSYESLGRNADALKIREETLALRKAKLGPDHPDTLQSMKNVADSYATLNRHAEALKLRQETYALRKTKLGPDHPDTLMSMAEVAESLRVLDRDAEALTMVDECLRLTEGKAVDPYLLQQAYSTRWNHFQKTTNLAECQQTIEKWEKLNLTNSDSLYMSACFRAAMADTLRASDKSPATAPQADADLDRSMAFLKQSVAAGYKNVSWMKTDKDLDSLRNRDDFKALMAAMSADKPSQGGKP